MLLAHSFATSRRRKQSLTRPRLLRLRLQPLTNPGFSQAVYFGGGGTPVVFQPGGRAGSHGQPAALAAGG
jgi:hypothetical protein